MGHASPKIESQESLKLGALQALINEECKGIVLKEPRNTCTAVDS